MLLAHMKYVISVPHRKKGRDALCKSSQYYSMYFRGKAPRGEYEEQHAGQNRWIMGLRPRTLKGRSPIRCSTITALTGFGRLIFELIYNKPSTSRQHNSTGTIFASQKVQTTKRAASYMTLNQRGHVQKSSET